MPSFADAHSFLSMPAPGLITPVLPNSYNEDAARYRKTPLASNTAVMADIIERKNATLPPKPDEAVLAAAAKKARRHVFFSTPTSSMRQSPVLPQDHLTMFPGTGGNVGKHATHEQQMPPPPYTPAGAATGGPYSVGSGRPSFDYACTPACVTARYIPPPPAHLHASQSTVNNVTTIFPSVIAASEALRINLGLDRNQTGLLFNGPPQQPGAPLTMPPQRNSSIPGVPVSHIPFDIASAMSQGGTQGTTTTHAVQYKIFTGMEPLPGMTQPLGCQSSNLPLVLVACSAQPSHIHLVCSC